MTTTNKKSNKSNATAKVNNNSTAQAKGAQAILAAAAQATAGLIKSSLGTRKSTLYKEGVLEGLEEKGKKSMRKKLRNLLFSICSSLVEEKDKGKQEKLIAAFNEFYTATYQVNDYSLSSICNENLSKERKDILSKALEIAKG